MLIYKVTNLVNGKVYIGKTEIPLIKRWRQHISNSRVKQYVLSKAIRKYGAHNFSVTTLTTASTRAELNELECKFIAQLQSNNSLFGYNMTVGGDGNEGHTLSPEGRKKVSAARKALGTSWSKNKVLSAEHRANIAAALSGNTNRLGLKHSEETIKKLVLNNKRGFLNKHHSEEAKQR